MLHQKTAKSEAKDFQQALLKTLREVFNKNFEIDYEQASPKDKVRLLKQQERLFPGQR